jgi:hypothetical protein
MNYDLAKQKYVSWDETSVNPNVAFNYGPMPYDMLLQKFEETDMGPDEDDYHNFARNTLTDNRPDAPAMAADEPRGRLNSSSALLQLHYYGHRGDADMPNHSEIFQDFVGSDWADPRGYATDPDMKELVKQEAARQRFKRLTPDMCEQVTGGRLSQEQEIEMRENVFKRSRDLIKVFSYQKDGRREGMRKAWRHVSAKVDAETTERRDDVLKTEGFVPKKYNIMVDSIIRDTRAFRESTADQCFEVQRYTKSGGKTAMPGQAKPGDGTDQDGKFAAEDASKTFKALGVLMSNIVSMRNDMQNVDQDIDYGKHTDAQMRRHEKFTRDIASILRDYAQESHWGQQDNSVLSKTPAPAIFMPSNGTVLNHSLPANYYLVAEKMFKSVAAANPSEMRKVVDMQMRDGKKVSMEDVKSMMAKTAKYKNRGTDGGGKDLSNVEIIDETTTTHNYSSAVAHKSDRRVENFGAEDFKTESDLTKTGRTRTRFEQLSVDEAQVDESQFNVNDSGERHIAPMGKKSRARRYAQVDGVTNDING